LPSEAQFSPAFAVVVADFDGDGAGDVFLSQIFLRPRRKRRALMPGEAYCSEVTAKVAGRDVIAALPDRTWKNHWLWDH